MHNHSDNFKPPGEQTVMGDAKNVFQFLTGIFMIAVHVTASFWAMIAKKPGTVGTRTYWFDVLCGNTMLLALSHNFPAPDQFLFQFAIVLMSGLYLRHLFSTMNQEEHIHTHCIGKSRFGEGDNGKFREAMIGKIVGLCICLTGCVPFGIFVIISALANAVRIMMVDERDRQRAVNLADAMAEQEYAMDNLDAYLQRRRKQ